MILIDTSIWIDHLRKGDPLVVDLLHDQKVLIHPWVVGKSRWALMETAPVC